MTLIAIVTSSQLRNAVLGRIAWRCCWCCATFPLIWVGGLVTTYKAGMAVPDWPTTYGYNLFLYPGRRGSFGPWDLFIEHGHRLFGAAVGLMTIGLVVVVWRLRCGGAGCGVAALGALALVIVQGVLGRDARDDSTTPTFAQIHGCVGPLFFAYAAATGRVHLALVAVRRPRPVDATQAGRLQRLAISTAAAGLRADCARRATAASADDASAGEFRAVRCCSIC